MESNITPKNDISAFIILMGLAHGSWNAPVIGVQGDFLQLIILLVLVELYRLGRHLVDKSKTSAMVS